MQSINFQIGDETFYVTAHYNAPPGLVPQDDMLTYVHMSNGNLDNMKGCVFEYPKATICEIANCTDDEVKAMCDFLVEHETEIMDLAEKTQQELSGRYNEFLEHLKIPHNFPICEEMTILRTKLDAANIKWQDGSDLTVHRTWWEYKGHWFSAINGFATYGGCHIAYNGGEQQGLLELEIDHDCNSIEGWLSADEVLEKMHEFD